MRVPILNNVLTFISNLKEEEARSIKFAKARKEENHLLYMHECLTYELNEIICSLSSTFKFLKDEMHPCEINKVGINKFSYKYKVYKAENISNEDAPSTLDIVKTFNAIALERYMLGCNQFNRRLYFGIKDCGDYLDINIYETKRIEPSVGLKYQYRGAYIGQLLCTKNGRYFIRSNATRWLSNGMKFETLNPQNKIWNKVHLEWNGECYLIPELDCLGSEQLGNWARIR